MKLVITIDVEEDGLFSGQYPRKPPGALNVAQLRRLEFIPKEFGFPLTLLATYPVVDDPASRDILSHWREAHGAEIGAHLHPWCTPPFEDLPVREPVPSDLLPLPLLTAKLQVLLNALDQTMDVQALAFRMGRFDFGQQIRRLLPACGLRVDSSVVPLRQARGVPGHFLSSADPHLLNHPSPAAEPVLEVPLTMIALSPVSARATYRAASVLPRKMRESMLSAFRYVGAVGIQPVWYPLASMRAAVRLHRERGGRVLNMFLHSSELHPGGTPMFETEASVNRLTGKIRTFLNWLRDTVPVEATTLSGLSAQMREEQG